MTPRPLNVLIVEDEAIVAVELELAVEDAGHRVAGIAADTEEALELAGEGGVDLALVDINLRDGRTGVDIASRLWREHAISVIFLTANPDQVPPDFPDALGVYPKPYDVHTVMELVRFAASVREQDGLVASPKRFRMSPWLKARTGGDGPMPGGR